MSTQPNSIAETSAPTVESLIVDLNHQHWQVRCNAIEALGKLGDPRAVGPLIAALKHMDRNTRAAAAEALGKLGDSRAVEPLGAAMDGEINDEVYQAEATALEKLGAATIAAKAQADRARKERERVATGEASKSNRGCGITLIVAGILIFILPSCNLQYRWASFFEILGIPTWITALICIIVGGVLLLTSLKE